MVNNDASHELPPNYNELKTAANRTSNWRERLEAVEELGQWQTKQTIDILTHRMNNDSVYKVREAAFHKLKRFGEDVQLPPRKQVDLSRADAKVLVRIKKSLPEGHTYQEFEEKFKKMRLDIYDAYEGEKGTDFEKWLEDAWASLSTSKIRTDKLN